MNPIADKHCVVLLLALLAILQSVAFGSDSETVKNLVASAEAEKKSLFQMLLYDGNYEPKSKIGQMLAAAKHAQSNRSDDSTRELLNTLPKSDLEMEAFFEFTQAQENREIQSFFRAYYEKSFDSVVRHPEKLHSIFLIAYEFGTKRWPDYDNIDWFCEEIGKVKSRDPRNFNLAVQREKPAMRRFLESCGRHKP